MRAELAVALGQPSPAPLDRFEAQASRDSLVELSGVLRVVAVSLTKIANATTLFADRCVAGIAANSDRLRWLADHTLATATALNPIVGYDMATAIVRHAEASGLSIRAAASSWAWPLTLWATRSTRIGSRPAIRPDQPPAAGAIDWRPLVRFSGRTWCQAAPDDHGRQP